MPVRPRRVILASQSPRRRELAVAAGWDVIVAPPPDAVEAEAPPLRAAESIAGYVTRLARLKADAVATRFDPADQDNADRVLVACDTLGEIDGIALGKPRDRSDAAAMIRRLSGRRHRVVTGVSLRIPAADHRTAATALRSPWTTHGHDGHLIVSGHTESEVSMDPIDSAAIEAYLESGGWRGKAGSCGLQDGLLPLRLVAGTADTVVGLPVRTIEQLLDRFHEKS